MHGTVIGSCPKAMLCELKPDGLEEGTIFAVNAGLDTSNVEKGYAVGWPKDPVATVSKLRRDLESETGKRIAVILTDSCCRPRRLGVTAFALTVCGIEPLLSQIGRKDIFGHELTMTHEAIAEDRKGGGFVSGIVLRVIGIRILEMRKILKSPERSNCKEATFEHSRS